MTFKHFSEPTVCSNSKFDACSFQRIVCLQNVALCFLKSSGYSSEKK